MIIAMTCGSLWAAPSTSPGPEVRLLKNSVLLQEPVYAEVLNPRRASEWKETIFRQRYSLKWFEVRRGEKGQWVRCTSDEPIIDYISGAAPPADDRDVERLDPLWLRTCGLDSAGKYWVRWGGGAASTLEMRSIPAQEQAGSELMGGRALTPSLATSVYAGYVLVGFEPPGKPAGPGLEARDRESYERLTRESTEELRREVVEALRKRMASETARVELLSEQLRAHPEFVFADNARLTLVGLLTFLGRCSEAADHLAKVNAGRWRDVAKEFSSELETVRRQQNSVCATSSVRP